MFRTSIKSICDIIIRGRKADKFIPYLSTNTLHPKSADRKSSTVSSPLMGEEEGAGEIVTRKVTPGVRQIYCYFRHMPDTPRNLPIYSKQHRKAIMLFAPLTDQCIPDCFNLCPMTVLQHASKTPEPTKSPFFLKSSYRILFCSSQSN
jgi:hypothetical protein